MCPAPAGWLKAFLVPVIAIVSFGLVSFGLVSFGLVSFGLVSFFQDLGSWRVTRS